MLRGREPELAVVDRAIDAARHGDGGCLVVVGEPGIGRSALLEAARERASDCRTLWTRGEASESHVEYSALHGLVRPLVPELRLVAPSHASTLSGALGLGGPTPPEAAAVGAAVLSLLSATATSGGRATVCIVDDLHHLDPSSSTAVLFAARRVRSDAVVFLLSVCDEDRGEALRSLPTVEVRGVDEQTARSLVRERLGVRMTAAVARRLVEETGGNPLGLLDVARSLVPEQLTGRAPLPDLLPWGAGVEQVIERRLSSIDPATRSALTLVALARRLHRDALERAAQALDLPAEAVTGAFAAGLASNAADVVSVRHPLVRMALASSGSLEDRRRAHRALADALPAGAEIERAWHRARGSPGRDDEIAGAMSRVADVCRSRGELTAAGAALRAAASLSSGDSARSSRLRLAADMAMRCGEPADPLLAECLVLEADPVARLELQAMRITEAATRGDHLTMAHIHREVLGAATELDPMVRAQVLAFELVRAWDDLDLTSAAESIRRLREIVDAVPFEHRPPALSMVLAVAAALSSGEADQLMAVASVVWEQPLLVAPVLTALRITGRSREHRQLFERALPVARATGSTGALAWILAAGGHGLLLDGEVGLARIAAAEAAELATAIGNPFAESVARSTLAMIAALRADQAGRCEQLAHLGELTTSATPHSARALVHLARAASTEADGDFDDAIAELETVRALGRRLPAVSVSFHRTHWQLVALYVRVGARARAEEVLDDLERAATGLPGAWPHAAVARCRGLLGAGDPSALFESALAHHEADGSSLEAARTHLMLGEWLRRSGQRAQARSHLNLARRAFDRCGASALSARAGAELGATGLRRPAPGAMAGLTPQELSVARQVAAGHTNRNAAAALYLSTKTVEMHLGRVYRKLGLASRSELIRLVAERGPGVLTAQLPIEPGSLARHD